MRYNLGGKLRFRSNGFTIVELLIVVVVIAILAAITIVAYNGITKQATESVLKNDLQQVSTQLGMIKAKGDAYPTDGSGLKVSNGTNLQYSKVSDDAFCATAQAKGQSFYLDSATGEIKAGMCGDHEDMSSFVALDPNNKNHWRQVSAGAESVCAVASNDRVYCWGGGGSRAMGNSLASYSTKVPLAVNMGGALAGKTVKQVSVGHGRACVVASDSQAYCWGGTGLGNNSTAESDEPVPVYTSGALAGKTVKYVSSGKYHSCAIASDDQVYCWGRNSAGLILGSSSVTTESIVPVAVDTNGALAGKTVKSINAYENHTCVVASDSQAYCWGYNKFASGQLGNNSLEVNSATPVAVYAGGALLGKTVKSISAGRDKTCAIASDDNAYCWGKNESTNPATYLPVPSAVDMGGVLAGKSLRTLDSGYDNTCAIASDSKVYCWGYSTFGAGGNNLPEHSSVFGVFAVDTSGVLLNKAIKSISVGDYTVCAIASDNGLYCWGYGESGQLGDNTRQTTVPYPVAVFPRP